MVVRCSPRVCRIIIFCCASRPAVVATHARAALRADACPATKLPDRLEAARTVAGVPWNEPKNGGLVREEARPAGRDAEGGVLHNVCRLDPGRRRDCDLCDYTL